jgi:NADP-dependent 3-hydroxy acid dehydrogenase YdfG
MPALADYFAIVTGGGGGIGRAICHALSRDGSAVWAVGRTSETLTETVAGCHGRGRAYPADLTDDTQVAKLAVDAEQEYGRVDVLVHCAGVISYGSVADSPVEALDAQYQSNVRVPYRVTQCFLPLLRKRPGQIVFVNSSIVFGSPPRTQLSQYAATQHAARAFADTLRQEVGGDGIRVLCVYPGRTATMRQARLYEKEGKPYRPELLLQPKDIATMVMAALALPATAEVTDINIRPAIKSY